MADADNNISAAGRPTTTMNTSTEGQDNQQHFPQVGFAVPLITAVNICHDPNTTTARGVDPGHQIFGTMAGPTGGMPSNLQRSTPLLNNTSTESQHQQHHQHAPPGGSTIPICAFANNDIEQDKTPPQINIRQINLGPGGSAISALTNNTSGSTSLFSTGNTTTVHAATGAAMTPRVNDNNNTHRRVFMAASPDVPTPDFSRPSSDDNSLLSGDDSLGWDIEADRMLAQIECDAQIDIDADNDIEPLPKLVSSSCSYKRPRRSRY